MRGVGAAAGLVLALGACDSTDAVIEPVAVTGQEISCDLEVEGLTARCVDEMSDARVSGTMDVLLDCEPAAGFYMCTGDLLLTNDNGTWKGVTVGVIENDADGGRNVYSSILEGTADYDGLRYTLHSDGADWPWDVTGVIEPIG
ncbi:hypothetical protein [Demequina sp.]|uniref:hypothetical protein n=1 Tax=Demequina sp. TaxID=2050685 RepID=UPI0025CC7882|nr:hypothetical protein [Demequina sp.]